MIDDSAIAASTAAVAFRKFFQVRAPKEAACSEAQLKTGSALCAEVMLNAVARDATRFGEQSQLTSFIERAKNPGIESGDLFKEAPALDRFWGFWKAQIHPLLAITKTTDEPFYLRSDVTSKLVEAQGLYDEAVGAVRRKVLSERLRVARELKQGLDVAAKSLKDNMASIKKLSDIDQKRIGLSEASQAADSWLELSKSIQEGDVTALNSGVAAYGRYLARFSNLLRLSSVQIAKSRQPESTCTSSGVLDPTKGFQNFCIQSASRLGVAGLRFVYVPCPSTNAGCETAGHFELLIRSAIQSKEGSTIQLRPLALGVADMQGHFSGSNFVMPPPPALTYQVFEDQVDKAVREMLPFPFQLELARTARNISVSNGPKISLKVRPTLALPGVQLSDVMTIELGPTGVTIDGKALVGDLVASLKAKVQAAIVSKKVALDGIEITTTSVDLPDEGCSGDISAIAATVAGTAQIGALLDDAKIKTSIRCDGKISVAFDAADRLTTLLKSKLQPLASFKEQNVSIEGLTAQVSVELAPQCSKTFSLDLKDKSALNKVVQDATAAIANCKAMQAIQAAKQALKRVDLFGFKGLILQSDSLKACTPSEWPIGVICFKSKVDITTAKAEQIEIEDDGRLLGSVKSRLAAVIKQVPTLQFNSPKLECRFSLAIPGISQEIPVIIPLDGSKRAEDIALDAAKDAIKAAFAPSKSLSVGGLDITFRDARKDGDSLTLVGGVSYAGIPGTVNVRVLPSFRVTADPPDVKALLTLVSMAAREKAGINIVFDGSGIPSLLYPISLSAPLFGGAALEVDTTLTVRANGKLQLGTVGITLPYWIPIASVLELGRANFELNLDHLDEIAFGAAVAITPGEATNDIIRIEARIAHKKPRIELLGQFIIIGMTLAETRGYWDYNRGVLDVTTGSGSQSILPLPKGRVVVDGPGCSIIGTASFALLGAHMDTVAGLLLGDPCKPGARPAVPEMAEKLVECERDRLGAICMSGNLKLGVVAADGRMSTQLASFRPKIIAHMDISGLAKIDANVNSRRSRLSARLPLGIRMSVVLPNVEGLSPELLEQLFRNLLSPSIDLDALLKGQFAINPTSKAGKGDGDASDAKRDSNDEDDGDSETQADQKPPAPPKDAPKEVVAGNYEGRPGPCRRKTLQIAAGKYQVLETCPNEKEHDPFGVRFRKEDADDVAIGRLSIEGSAVTLDDGRSFILACERWPCKLDRVWAVWVAEPESIKALDPKFLVAVPANDLLRPDTELGLRFKGIISTFAKRQLAKDSAAAPNIVCVGQYKDYCIEAAINIRTSAAEDSSDWTLASGWGSVTSPLRKESFLSRLLGIACPSTPQCNAEARKIITEWGKFLLLGTSRADGAGLPSTVLAVDFQSDKELAFYILTSGENGRLKAKNKIKLEISQNPSRSVWPGLFLSGERLFVPTCQPGQCSAPSLALSPTIPLLDQLGPLMATTSDTVIVVGVDHASALVKNGQTRTVVSALLSAQLDDGKTGAVVKAACGTSASWGQLESMLKANDREIYIKPDYADKLLKDGDGDIQFTRDLSNPVLSPDKYHDLPLHFLPPFDPQKCIRAAT